MSWSWSACCAAVASAIFPAVDAQPQNTLASEVAFAAAMVEVLHAHTAHANAEASAIEALTKHQPSASAIGADFAWAVGLDSRTDDLLLTGDEDTQWVPFLDAPTAQLERCCTCDSQDTSATVVPAPQAAGLAASALGILTLAGLRRRR